MALVGVDSFGFVRGVYGYDIVYKALTTNSLT